MSYKREKHHPVQVKEKQAKKGVEGEKQKVEKAVGSQSRAKPAVVGGESEDKNQHIRYDGALQNQVDLMPEWLFIFQNFKKKERAGEKILRGKKGQTGV